MFVITDQYLLVPAEFTNLLQFYTKQGYRVIGAAHKQLKVRQEHQSTIISINIFLF